MLGNPRTSMSIFIPQCSPHFSVIRALALAMQLTVSSADPLDQWLWRNPLPTGNPLSRVVYLGDTFLAVGGGGASLTSPDGSNWRMGDSSGKHELTDAAFGNNIFVAVGAAPASGGNGSFGVVLTSADRATWAVSNSFTNVSSLNSVAYGAGNFVAVSGDGDVFTSGDGTNWTWQVAIASYLRTVRYINGRFFALGNHGTVLSSADGIGWTPGTGLSASDVPLDIAYGSGRLVAVGGRSIFASSDGNFWTNVASTGGLSLWGIAWGGSAFAAVGLDGALMNSSDGLKWTRCNSGVGASLVSASYGNGSFVAVGSGVVLVSTNGLDWHNLSSGVTTELEDVVCADGTFLAVGDAGAILRSPDGVQWSAAPSGINKSLHAIAYDGGRFAAVGDLGTMIISTNGANWVSVARTNLMVTLRGVAAGNGTFVAGGDAGILLTSTDAKSWMLADSGTTASIRDIVYGNALYVAVALDGTTGYILRSTDSLQWTAESIGSGTPLLGVGYGGGRFVAVGPGTILTSTNAVDWIRCAPPTGAELYRVRYGHGTFVVIGQNGTILTSTNGLDWISRPSGTGNYLFGAAYGRQTFVCVGAVGAILQSEALPPSDLLLGPISVLEGGACSILITGPPGKTWAIQGSTDLRNWDELGRFLSTNITAQFLDYDATNFDRRFYRAVTQ